MEILTVKSKMVKPVPKPPPSQQQEVSKKQGKKDGKMDKKAAAKAAKQQAAAEEEDVDMEVLEDQILYFFLPFLCRLSRFC